MSEAKGHKNWGEMIVEMYRALKGICKKCGGVTCPKYREEKDEWILQCGCCLDENPLLEENR